MNEEELKRNLLQLVNEGWFNLQVTDDLLEDLLGRPEYAPSDEVKERCLSNLRLRLIEARRRNAGKPHVASTGVLRGKASQSRRPKPGVKLKTGESDL